MKFSTILSSLALCALQVYASPVDIVSSPANGLQTRNLPEYCCVSLAYHDHTENKFVSWVGNEFTIVSEYGRGCKLVAIQSVVTGPSGGACKDWRFVMWACYPAGSYESPRVSVQPANVCS
ncbi:hypothetical protein E4U21_003097 [Claviceps maximensis]|nr:hypothetical protein E4U21_003097 [Claviceps maximensis]